MPPFNNILYAPAGPQIAHGFRASFYELVIKTGVCKLAKRGGISSKVHLRGFGIFPCRPVGRIAKRLLLLEVSIGSFDTLNVYLAI